jgi:hypothetical protein
MTIFLPLDGTADINILKMNEPLTFASPLWEMLLLGMKENKRYSNHSNI